MIRTRLGDAAADNISAAVFGSAGYAPATGQQSLITSVGAALAARGIDPATATPAQVMSAYQQGQGAQLAQLQAGSLNPAPAIVSSPGPSIAPAANLPIVAAPAGFSLSDVPAWAWIAGGAAALYFLK